MDLQDEVVIVTGASGNLGAAVVGVLAGYGARLVCVDRAIGSRAPATDRDRTLALAGRDLTQSAVAEAVVAEAIARFGRVTALVNTVGGFRMARVTEGALDQWDQMMTLNAKVALVTSAAVLPALVASGRGSIVHIAAQPGLKAGAGQAAYAASKAAVIRIVEAIAAEHRKDRVIANAILPGTIDTPQNRADMPDAEPESFVPPEAIAELVAFLVSARAACVTGGAIPATGLV